MPEPLPEPELVPPMGELEEPLLPKADPELPPKDEEEEPNDEPLLLPNEDPDDPEDPNDELAPPVEDPEEPKEDDEPNVLVEAPPAPVVAPVGVMPPCICACCPNNPMAGTLASPRWMIRQSSFPVMGSR